MEHTINDINRDYVFKGFEFNQQFVINLFLKITIKCFFYNIQLGEAFVLMLFFQQNI